MTNKPNEVMGGGELFEKFLARRIEQQDLIPQRAYADEIREHFLSDLRTHDQELIERLIKEIKITKGSIYDLVMVKSMIYLAYQSISEDKKEKANEMS